MDTVLGKRAWWISLIVHGCFFGVILLAMLFNWLDSREDVEPFVLVAPPSAEAAQEDVPQEDVVDPTSDPMDFTLPNVPEVEITPLPDVPEPVVDARPPPKMVEKPVNERVESKRMNIDDFRKANGTPQVSSVPKPKPRQSVKLPGIGVPKRNNTPSGFESAADSALANAASDASAYRVYMAYLKSRIDIYWARLVPKDKSGLAANVAFTVSAAGQVSGVRITKSSGDSQFDQAVRTLFQQINPLKAPPDGKSHTFNQRVMSQ